MNNSAMTTSVYRCGKIYKLTSKQTDKIYVGSTCATLAKRLYNHERAYDSFCRGVMPYSSAFELIRFVDHKIELIEKFPCDTMHELVRREGQLIRLLPCVNVNKHIGLTDVEKLIVRRAKGRLYYQANKAAYAAYYQANKARLKAKRDEAKRQRLSAQQIENVPLVAATA